MSLRLNKNAKFTCRYINGKAKGITVILNTSDYWNIKLPKAFKREAQGNIWKQAYYTDLEVLKQTLYLVLLKDTTIT